jgi:hypothetical protein
LLSYEDEDEKWHKMDASPTDLAPALLNSDFEGTMDSKKIKYRVVAFAMEGEGAVRKFGDESDYQVEDGTSFPAIPPALPATRLPKLVSDTNVSGRRTSNCSFQDCFSSLLSQPTRRVSLSINLRFIRS